jgi:hypothetical protein
MDGSRYWIEFLACRKFNKAIEKVRNVDQTLIETQKKKRNPVFGRDELIEKKLF